MDHLVAPSLLACDFSKLAEEVEMVNKSQADWLHLDVMDGKFVPNITFGMPIIKAIKKLSKKPLDTHLMIEEPGKYVESFAEAGADILSVHVEACNHLHRNIQQIKSHGMRAGVALNPHTAVSAVSDVLEDIDLVVIMSVNPGFGGQKFIYRSLHKIKMLRDEITTRNLSCKIEVDGGVGLHNAEKILEAGADVLVAGSSVFKSEDPSTTIEEYKAIEKRKTFQA